MRQITVVLVLLFGATEWRAAAGLATAPASAPAAAVEGLQADFDNDGFADLAVGVAGENLGAIGNGGAVNVLYGSAIGLTGAGSQRFTQDSPGVPGVAEPGDGLVMRWRLATSTAMVSLTWRSGCRWRMWARSSMRGQ
jgi:hypothetical protein